MLASITQKLRGWKTMVVSGFYTVAGASVLLHDEIADAIGQAGVDWKSLVDPKYVPWILIGTGITFALLRKATTGPVGSKGDTLATPQTKAGD